jgi:hypothetical protein
MVGVGLLLESISYNGAKMNHKTLQKLCLLLFVFLLADLTGCERFRSSVVVATTQKPTITQIQTPKATQLIASPTASQTATSTRSSPSITIMPTHTPVTSSPTTAPTLSANQAADLVADLLKNNAGCTLPCWWGFIPGKSSEATVSDFLSLLDKKIHKEERPDGTILWPQPHLSVPGHDYFLGISFLVTQNIVRTIFVSAGIYQGDYMVLDDPDFMRYMNNYLLSNILSNIGKPAEILVYVDSESQGGVVSDYDLILFFPAHGVMAKYAGMREELGNQFRLCPDKTQIDLWLWSPEEKLTALDVFLSGILETKKNIRQKTFELHRPLVEVTDMSIEKFTGVFTDGKKGVCLETPMELWER